MGCPFCLATGRAEGVAGFCKPHYALAYSEDDYTRNSDICGECEYSSSDARKEWSPVVHHAGEQACSQSCFIPARLPPDETRDSLGQAAARRVSSSSFNSSGGISTAFPHGHLAERATGTRPSLLLFRARQIVPSTRRFSSGTGRYRLRHQDCPGRIWSQRLLATYS